MNKDFMELEELPIVLVRSMNDTHLEEMTIMNKLSSAVRNDNEISILKTLQELIEHTNIHFITEEKLMEEIEFPNFNAHKSEHERHLRELKSVKTYFEKHKESRAVYAYLEGNLKSWTIHHIETMDTEAAKFIKGKSS